MTFTIITVNYNNCEGLRRTIESVVGQTFRDFEFIVIDGGSTDGSADVLREYDKDITYWVSEKDGGIYNAMNKGIRQATGDYLNFMNSGDCFYDNTVLQRVSAVVGHASQRDRETVATLGKATGRRALLGNGVAYYDIIVGRDYHFSEEKQRGHASVQPPRTTMMHFFMATLDHQSAFIRRELFNESPYREDYRLVSDWIFFTEKIVSEGRRVQFIPDIVCRREEGGLSDQQRERNRKEISRWLHEYLPQGVYADYATLSKLDKTTLYRLFDICENAKMRKALTFCIKVINRIFKLF
jgi:glycosyltransferase involved in cell wall biosynthesis